MVRQVRTTPSSILCPWHTMARGRRNGHRILLILFLSALQGVGPRQTAMLLAKASGVKDYPNRQWTFSGILATIHTSSQYPNVAASQVSDARSMSTCRLNTRKGKWCMPAALDASLNQETRPESYKSEHQAHNRGSSRPSPGTSPNPLSGVRLDGVGVSSQVPCK